MSAIKKANGKQGGLHGRGDCIKVPEPERVMLERVQQAVRA